MTYSFEQRRKIRRAMREAGKKESITPITKKRLTEAKAFIETELALANKLLEKPIINTNRVE